MSAIYQKTVLEALDRRPAQTVEDLCTATGYYTTKVLQTLIECRIEGHVLLCEKPADSLSTWTHEKGTCCGSDTHD